MILIVPCYNEANRINSKTWIVNANLFTGIIFVNDGSTDNTIKIINQLISQAEKKQITNIKLHILDTNQGKAEAIRAGVLYAKNIFSEEKYLGYCDADLSTPLNEMHRLFKKCQTNQNGFLLGSRVKLSGFNVKRSGIRHYLGRASATLISLMLKITVYDTQAGAKIFNSQHADTLFKEKFISRWLFDCELILRAQQDGISVYEEPLRTWIHQDNSSKVNFSSYIKSLIDLIKIRNKYTQSN